MALLRTILSAPGHLFRALGRLSFFVVARLPVFLVALTGFYFSFEVFSHLNEDTTSITNAGFGIFVALAALSFSASRAIANDSDVSDRLAFAGERFFHAAILTVTASLLKYVALELGASDPGGMALPQLFSEPHWRSAVPSLGAGILVGLLFFQAVSSAQGGLVVASRVLWPRFYRYPESDSFW